MSNKQLVAFDFDYTLVDSGDAVVATVCAAFSAMRLQIPDAERTRQTIGLGLEETFRSLASRKDWDRAEEFRQQFLEAGDETMVTMTRVYPAVPVMLRQLRKMGLLTCIVSTKVGYRIRQILDHNGLLDAFGPIIGGDEVERPKPHPEGLLAAVERHGCAPEAVVYVGDSSIDGQLAKNAGVDFIAVTSGTTSKEELSSFSPLSVLKDLARLPGVIAGRVR